MGSTNYNTDNNKSSNTGTWIAAGIAVTGLSLVLLNRNARNKVIDTSMQVRNSAMDYASDIKSDPSGVKNSLIERIKTTSSITMEAVSKIQEILNNQGQDLKETATHLIDDSKQMIDHAKVAKESLTDAKDKVMDAKDKAADAKDTLTEDMDHEKHQNQKNNSNQNSDSNQKNNSNQNGNSNQKNKTYKTNN